MRVRVNGDDQQLSDGITVADLLEQEGEPIRHVLVEVNGEYLPARLCGDRVLAEGDQVEIIRPAFGG
jgi:thiamine biosynthesis protein ThiS